MSRSQPVTRPEPDFPMTSRAREYRRVWAAAALILVAVLLVTAVVFAGPTVTAVVSYLEGMRSAHAQFTPQYVPYLAYVLLCAAGVAMCLPVGALLTAVGGAIFGFAGFPMALVGITAGSIIPFVVSRKFGGSALAKFDSRLVERFRRGFQRNAAQFLILMRLLPWAPFSVITIIAGALKMPLANFLIATALGFVPAGVALNAIGRGAARFGALQKISAIDLLRDPEFLLLFGGIGGLAVLDIIRRRLNSRRLLD